MLYLWIVEELLRCIDRTDTHVFVPQKVDPCSAAALSEDGLELIADILFLSIRRPFEVAGMTIVALQVRSS